MARLTNNRLILLMCACYYTTTCNTVTTSTRDTCGGIVKGLKGTITSPNYPQNYPDNALCRWTIQGPAEATSIQVTFDYFDVEWGSSCEWDSVIIKDKNGKQVGKPLCGRLDEPKVTVPGDTAIIVFKSDDAANEKGFQVNFVATAPSKPDAIGSCNFDEGLCSGLTNVANNKDNFDWMINSGSTPTVLTGPTTDHSGQGKYIYMESSGQSEGDRAELETGVMLGTKCLQFVYHMYGIIGMGKLKVYIETERVRSLVMSLSGNQGNEWKEAKIQINEQFPYKVVFQGIVGKSDYSDIAIDDISFSNSVCSGKTGCGGVFTESSGSFTSPGYPNDYPDNSRCYWTIQPKTKSAFIVITFKPFEVEMEPACRDDYVIVTDSQDQPVMQKRFCGFYGDGFGLKVPGNMAKVHFHSNDHLSRKGFRASYKTIPTSSTGDCDFDNGKCAAWNNDVNDDFDWSVGKGNTPSFFTGPSHDFYGLGVYAFIEASHRRPGDRAILISGTINGTQCLSFSYNMNGRGMGSLIVSIRGSHLDGSRTVWKTSGDHGKFWLTENIDTDVGRHPYQVMFEGVVGSSFTSDIAIDEISFKAGRCPSKPGCGELFTAASGSFHSPQFPLPYPTGVDCIWTILPPPQFEDVAITFDHVDIEQSAQCSKDYIAVEDITGTPKGDKICGRKNNHTVEVDWHQTSVHFHSDSDVTATGFEATYRAFGSLPACGGELAGKTGTFSSPNYPANYPNKITCDWEITTTGTDQIMIQFEDFAIDDSPVTCAYDYLLVIDAQHANQVGKYCGMTKPQPIKIAGNVANIRFQASHLSSARGFKARFTAV